MKKIVLNAFFFRQKLSASPKNGNTPPPPRKNNGPSLIASILKASNTLLRFALGSGLF